MNLQFEYPALLYLFWLVPLAAVSAHVLIERGSLVHRGFLSPLMARKLAPPPPRLRTRWQLVLFSLGMLLALIAAARPQWGLREEITYRRGRDLLILLDVSRSMLATDVHPSRLGRAKVDILDLVRELRGDRVGLMAFRGRPVLLCPLTTDYAFFRQVLEGVGVDSAPAGETNIGDAIREALEALETDAGAHKAIVLVSDGEDLANRVPAALEEAQKRGVTIFTVGFGSTAGAKIPGRGTTEGVVTYRGQEVVSRINHELLRSIAEKTGGAYVPVGVSNVRLGALYRDHLSRLAAREIEESVRRRHVERYQTFLLPAVLCLMAALALSRGRPRVGTNAAASARPPATATLRPAPLRKLDPAPKPLRKLAVGLVMLGTATGHSAVPTNANATAAQASPRPAAGLPATNMATPVRADAREAQRLYQRGHYAEAAEAYLAAARAASGPASRAVLHYNAGCALFKAGRYQEAADQFREAGETEAADNVSAAHNLGVALYRAAGTPQPAGEPEQAEGRLATLEQSAAAFQRALRLDPDRQATRQSLAAVTELLPEARDQAKLARLLATYGAVPPDMLADRMLLGQREVLERLPGALTNDTPSQIEQFEALAEQQEHTADLLIPLKSMLLNAALQQAQAASTSQPVQARMAELEAFVEHLRDRMYGTATALRDLDRAAYQTAQESEALAYVLWKGLASYGLLLREDLLRQTNAVELTTAQLDRPVPERQRLIGSEQSEALDLTRRFAERFQAAVPPEGLTIPAAPTNQTAAAATATNQTQVLLSPAERQHILELAEQASTAQQAALDCAVTNLTTALEHQRRAYALLDEIQRLLPKPPQQQSAEQPQQQDQQQQQQAPQPEPQPAETQSQQQEEQPAERRREELSPEDVRRLLEKARQREKEHEEEKRRQAEFYVPLTPTERDW